MGVLGKGDPGQSLIRYKQKAGQILDVESGIFIA